MQAATEHKSVGELLRELDSEAAETVLQFHNGNRPLADVPDGHIETVLNELPYQLAVRVEVPFKAGATFTTAGDNGLVACGPHISPHTERRVKYLGADSADVSLHNVHDTPLRNLERVFDAR